MTGHQCQKSCGQGCWQGSWNRKAGVGQPGQDSQDRTARSEQQRQESLERTDGTGHLGQDIWHRTTRTGQFGQDSQDRTAKTGRTEHFSLTGHPEQDTEAVRTYRCLENIYFREKIPFTFSWKCLENKYFAKTNIVNAKLRSIFFFASHFVSAFLLLAELISGAPTSDYEVNR